jgi:GT2 family glycosyltransferase
LSLAPPIASLSSNPAAPRRAAPDISVVVVHWRSEAILERLLEAWTSHGFACRQELVVVDNSGSAPPLRPPAKHLVPPRNLGFAGGVNLGVAHAGGEIVLILNGDAIPEPGALESLVAGFERHPQVSALAPRLVGPDGHSQHRWQLRRLPSGVTLLWQALLVPAGGGAGGEPAAGSRVEQPAGAALAIRRRDLLELGGMDERFHPAWFEDVDLARRMKLAGKAIRYWPAARVYHLLGSSIGPLGFGRFLWTYYRNYFRYLSKHHGARLSAACAVLLPAALLLRLILLPFRCPRRATTRREALEGLALTLLGAVTGWRRPRAWR